jgi:hypothetical protein
MSNLHKKFKNNDCAESGFVAVILMFCFCALIIDSVCITWFTTQWYGSSSITPIALPTGVQTFSSNQNFQTCSLNSSTWLITGSSTWKNWCDYNQTGIGISLYSLDAAGGRVYSWLLLNNIVIDTNGNVVNSYNINNSVGFNSGAPYVIAIRYTGGTDQIELRVDNDGFHIPNYVIPQILSRPMTALGDQYFMPAQNPDRENAVITTSYNNNANTLTFTFNGQSYTANNLKPDANIFGIFGRDYAGVGSNYIGFTLQSVNTANSIVLNNSGNALNQILNFITSLTALMLFGVPTTILPAEIALVAIRLPEAGITICVILMIIEALT